MTRFLGPLPALSLNCVIRLSQPIRAMQLKIQASWTWARTVDWAKRMCRDWVDTARQKDGGHLERLLTQRCRILPRGDCVQVDHALDAVVIVLHLHPVADCAKIIAQGWNAGRLDSGKDALHTV